MNQYIEASPKAKMILIIVVLLWSALALLLHRFDMWFPVQGSPLAKLEQVSDRALITLIVGVTFYLGLSVLVVIYAIWTVRHRQWPPLGHPMPFRTRVREIRRPVVVWVFASLLLAIYMTHIGMRIYSWTQLNRLISEFTPLLEQHHELPMSTPRGTTL